MSSGVFPTILESAFRESLVKEGRQSLATHRDAVRGSGFPPPKAGSRPPTFFHGFLLPFSLLLATLRHPTLGHTYLKLICVRALVVGVAAAVVFHVSDGSSANGKPHIVVTRTKSDKSTASKPVHAHAPGVDVDIDDATGEKKITVLGADIPVVEDKHGAKAGAAKLREGLKSIGGAKGADGADADDGDDDASEGAAAPAPAHAATNAAPEDNSKLARIGRYLSTKWTWILWFVGVFSMVEGVIVFFSRRYDDWISFHVSLLARTRPEERAPKPPKITFEPRWVMKKLKRRVRGYVVFAAGIPFLAPSQLIPALGKTIFAIGLTVWGWYWLTIFTAAKSAHAWEDEHTAPSPYLIRELRDRPPAIRLLKPLNLYARLWARFTRSMNAPAMTFERTPAPFLGLALARMILSLPGIYLLARPIIPVAAGRLCAETDPYDRFSLRRDG
jgi:hypothetical protein